MGWFSNQTSNHNLGDSVYELISSYASKLISITDPIKYADIEAKTLLFHLFMVVTFSKFGDSENPKIEQMLQNLHAKFKSLPDDRAKKILLANGYRSMLQFLQDRSDYYDKNLTAFYQGGPGAMLNGLCLPLYKTPLRRIQFFELEDGKIGFSDEYFYDNLSVVIDFMVEFDRVKRNFEKEIQSLLSREITR